MLQCLLFVHICTNVVPLKIQLSKGQGLDSKNGFNPTTFCTCSKHVTHYGQWSYFVSYNLTTLPIERVLWIWTLASPAAIECVEVRSNSSFCWYWWNCGPSQFKLSIHTKTCGLCELRFLWSLNYRYMFG